MSVVRRKVALFRYRAGIWVCFLRVTWKRSSAFCADVSFLRGRKSESKGEGGMHTYRVGAGLDVDADQPFVNILTVIILASPLEDLLKRLLAPVCILQIE